MENDYDCVHSLRRGKLVLQCVYVYKHGSHGTDQDPQSVSQTMSE